METIADPWLGRDVLRLFRVRLDLLAEALDKRTKVIDLVAIIWAPHGLEQFPMGYGFISVLREVSKQIQFLRRQVGCSCTLGDRSCVEIYGELADLEPGRRRLGDRKTT